MMDQKKINSYIDKVISDACTSENRANDAAYQYCIIQDTVVFAIKCRFNRVIRRVVWRLENNFKKNFPELDFCCVYPESVPIANAKFAITKLPIYDLNHSFARWDIFGEGYCICTYAYLNKRYKELLNPNFDGFADYNKHIRAIEKINSDFAIMTWDEYKEIYKQLYGKELHDITEEETYYGGNYLKEDE